MIAEIIDNRGPETTDRLWCDFQGVGILRQTIIDQTRLVDRPGRHPAARESLLLGLEENLQLLSKGIMNSRILIAALPTRYITPTTAYDNLTRDYTAETEAEGMQVFEVPTQSITGIQALPGTTGESRHEPVLWLRVKTSLDVPREVMGAGGLVTQESCGSWYRFPIEHAELACLSPQPFQD